MPKINFEPSGAEMEVYGDVHIAVGLDGETKINLVGCKVVRIWPPGKFTLEGLSHSRISSIIPDEQPGHVLFRDPDLPPGREEYTSMITIPHRARLKIIMPSDPD